MIPENHSGRAAPVGGLLVVPVSESEPLFSRATARRLAVTLLAAAVAVSAVGHACYLLPVPSRFLWFAAVLGLFFAVRPLCGAFLRGLVMPALRRLPMRERGLFVALPVVAGALLAAGIPRTLADTLWLYSPPRQVPLKWLLRLADAGTLIGTLFGLCSLAVLRRSHPELVEAKPVAGWFSARAALVGGVVFVAAANLFAVSYLAREHTVYFYDLAGYWMRTADLGEQLRASPREACREVVRSIHATDYTLVPSAPLAPVLALVGGSRAAYVLAVVNLYALSAVLLLTLLLRRTPLAGSEAPSRWASCVPWLVASGLPCLWAPVLRGYLDVGGVALALGVLLAYFRGRPAELRWHQLLLIGSLLAAMFLFRRWYAYWVVAFLLLMAAECAGGFVGGKRRTLRTAWEAARPFAVVAGTAALLLFVIARPMLVRTLTTDYAELYAGYQNAAGLVAGLLPTASYFGYLTCVLFLGGAALLIASRE